MSEREGGLEGTSTSNYDGGLAARSSLSSSTEEISGHVETDYQSTETNLTPIPHITYILLRCNPSGYSHFIRESFRGSLGFRMSDLVWGNNAWEGQSKWLESVYHPWDGLVRWCLVFIWITWSSSQPHVPI